MLANSGGGGVPDEARLGFSDQRGGESDDPVSEGVGFQGHPLQGERVDGFCHRLREGVRGRRILHSLLDVPQLGQQRLQFLQALQNAGLGGQALALGQSDDCRLNFLIPGLAPVLQKVRIAQADPAAQAGHGVLYSGQHAQRGLGQGRPFTGQQNDPVTQLVGGDQGSQ